MSAAFSIEKPIVVATLSRPIDHSAGCYAVSDVHGGIPGSKKRKRSELAVGVDGEGLNIYDIQTSKLITSYSIPPQSSFTCPPCSLRLKKIAGEEAERRTYLSTTDTTSKITLFAESGADEETRTSSVTVRELEGNNKTVKWLTTVFNYVTEGREDLVAIHEDGEIQCLDGDTLQTKWTSPATTLARNTTMPEVLNHRVEFAQLTDLYAASNKMLQGREDIMSVFPQDISADGFNPQLLVIITSPVDPALQADRTLHIVSLPSRIGNSSGNIHSVNPLVSLAIPWNYQENSETIGKREYNLQVTSGLLYELGGGYVTAFELTGSRPRSQPQMFVDGASSFLPLSSSTIIAASPDLVGIYHRLFQSTQASVRLSTGMQLSKKRKHGGENLPVQAKTCTLVTYSPKHGLIHAIIGSDLVAFRIDSRQDKKGRRRALGLLIDSLGRGVAQKTSTPLTSSKEKRLKSLRSYAASSDPKSRRKIDKIFSKMDRCIMQQDIEAFEKHMAEQVGLKRDENELLSWSEKQKSNGVPATNNLETEVNLNDTKPIPYWLWPKPGAEYPYVEPRVVRYALSRIFSWTAAGQSTEFNGSDDGRLAIVFFPHNVLNLLIGTGNMTRTMIQSALRHDGQLALSQEIPAGQLLDVLVELDPELHILLSVLSNTYLDASDLLHGIRLLMQSYELIGEQPYPMTNGASRHSVNGDVEENVEEIVEEDVEKEIKIEQEQAATALSMAEYYLEDYSSIRGCALNLAIAKLHGCPDSAVLSALRSGFTSAEIMSLVHLLRCELARGAWTSRYLESYPDESGGDEADQGHTILLVSGLLNCCVDALGAGGWLSGDSSLINGDRFESEDLITSLNLEVSAALEGIEEASFVKGLTTEMVRYGESVRTGVLGSTQSPSHTERAARPIRAAAVGREAAMLPFGLRAEQQVPLVRVGAGGEVLQRTARDIGRSKSRRVGKYSRERIVI